MSPNPESAAPIADETIGDASSGVSGRHFVGYVLAGTTLTVAGRYVVNPDQAAAAEGVPGATSMSNGLSPDKYKAAGGPTPIPSNNLPADDYDFMDLMRDTTRAVTQLLTLEVKPDGRVHFDMPRVEVGQGVETGVAQIIADQMEISYDHVDITQSKARPELLDAQLTGGSSAPLFAVGTAARVE